jgi:predicted branched-subunit amino acid permease
MSSSLSQKIDNKITKKFLSLIAFGITDETFAVASMRKESDINAWTMLGLNLTAYLSWVFGTILGLLIGDALPSSLKSSMGIALYSMFVGLLVPSLKKSSPVITVVLISIATNCLIKWVPLFSFISMGWGIIISTVIAALLGAFIYPVHDKERTEG